MVKLTTQEEIVGQLEAALEDARIGNIKALGLFYEVKEGGTPSSIRKNRKYMCRFAFPWGLEEAVVMREEMKHIARTMI